MGGELGNILFSVIFSGFLKIPRGTSLKKAVIAGEKRSRMSHIFSD